VVDQVAAAHPTLRKVWVDGGYCRHLGDPVETGALPNAFGARQL